MDEKSDALCHSKIQNTDIPTSWCLDCPLCMLGPDPSTQGQSGAGKQSNSDSDDHRAGDRVEHS